MNLIWSDTKLCLSFVMKLFTSCNSLHHPRQIYQWWTTGNFNDCIVQILLTIAEHKISFSVVINLFQIGLLFDFACSFSTGSYNHDSYKLWCTCYDIIHIQDFNKMDILLQIYGSNVSTQVTHEDGLLVHCYTIPKKLKLLIINSQCISSAGRVVDSVNWFSRFCFRPNCGKN